MHRYHTQYEQVRLPKETINATAATLQIDYSENYLCGYLDESSALFFYKHQVSIHPMVAHFKLNDGTLSHQSFVGISAEMSHAAPTTLAFLKKRIASLSQIRPFSTVHIISDSPASQYRNKSIVKVIANSQRLLGVQATWEFLESGHRKGPCDGVGASVKRAADTAVKKGQIITNTSDFFGWAVQSECAPKFIFIDGRDVQNAEKHGMVWHGAIQSGHLGRTFTSRRPPAIRSVVQENPHVTGGRRPK